MCSLALGSRLCRGSLRGTGSGTDTCALRGTGLPTDQPSEHKYLCQQPRPAVSAEAQLQPLAFRRWKCKISPNPPVRSAPRALLLRCGRARLLPTTNQAGRRTQTHRPAALSPKPPPSRTGADTCTAAAAFDAAAFDPPPAFRPAREPGRRAAASRPHLPGPVSLVDGHRAPSKQLIQARVDVAPAQKQRLTPHLPPPPPTAPARISLQGRAGHASRFFISLHPHIVLKTQGKITNMKIMKLILNLYLYLMTSLTDV